MSACLYVCMSVCLYVCMSVVGANKEQEDERENRQFCGFYAYISNTCTPTMICKIKAPLQVVKYGGNIGLLCLNTAVNVINPAL